MVRKYQMARDWNNKHLRMKPEVSQIFEDLEEYLDFCKYFGHVYNEADLYNDRGPWGELQRAKNGKHVRNNWSQFLKRNSAPRYN
jgi:hypothetical protein